MGRHAHTAYRPNLSGPNANVGANLNAGRAPGRTPGGNIGFQSGLNTRVGRTGGFATNHQYPAWNFSRGGANRSVSVFSPFLGGLGIPFLGYSQFGLNRYGYGYGNRYGYGGYGRGFGLGYPYYGFGYRRIFPYLGFGLGGLGYRGFGYGGLGYGGYGYSPYGYGYGTGGSTTAIVQQPVQQPAAEQPSTTTASGQFAIEGEAQFRAGQYKAAIQSWRHALVDDPQNGVLVLMLSQALFADGQFDEAAGAAQQGLAMLPEDQWNVVVGNYKELYGRSSDYAAQLKELEKDAKQQTDNPADLFLLGYHYGFLGYPEPAVKKLDQLIKFAPQDELAKRLRGLFSGEEPVAPGESASAAQDDTPAAEPEAPTEAAP